ncbi:hypothetical protein ONZ45_g18751 [Pleurotus djamor]|nr:hypothetical protein ONZ45_g18751 [Pleurotus djamor]
MSDPPKESLPSVDSDAAAADASSSSGTPADHPQRRIRRLSRQATRHPPGAFPIPSTSHPQPGLNPNLESSFYQFVFPGFSAGPTNTFVADETDEASGRVDGDEANDFCRCRKRKRPLREPKVPAPDAPREKRVKPNRAEAQSEMHQGEISGLRDALRQAQKNLESLRVEFNQHVASSNIELSNAHQAKESAIARLSALTEIREQERLAHVASVTSLECRLKTLGDDLGLAKEAAELRLETLHTDFLTLMSVAEAKFQQAATEHDTLSRHLFDTTSELNKALSSQEFHKDDQHAIKEMKMENEKLKKNLESHADTRRRFEDDQRAFEELKMENEKLKKNLEIRVVVSRTTNARSKR